MSRLNTILTLLKNGDKKKIGKAIALNISAIPVFHFLPDSIYIKLLYRFYFGRKLDFKKAKTFNEKLQWIKIYDRKPIYSVMVDKCSAKEFASSRIGKEHIIKNIAVWNSVDEIDFDSLPDQFVIKCTHDSGSICICKDKKVLDVEAIKEKLRKRMTTSSFMYGREWPYKNVRPRIIAEELLIDEETNDLKDYKFFCFNGKVKCFKVDFGRFINHRANYYDTNCNLLMFGEDECPPDYSEVLEIPDNLNKMIDFAEVLSKGTKFLRVDFYSVSGKIYFGEMTFFPASGFGTFTDEKWDYKLGSWINLTDSERGIYDHQKNNKRY